MYSDVDPFIYRNDSFIIDTASYNIYLAVHYDGHLF
jgi:hypothetical protein